MMRELSIAVLVAGTVAVGGCATHQGQHEQAGVVIGGVLGGLLGSQVGDGRGRTAAIIAGTLIGAQIGGAIGRSMDDDDRARTAYALENARTGQPAVWRNPDTGHQYAATPTRTYDAASGPCRDYTIEAIIDGRRELVHGTACRQADGTWRNVGG